MKITFVYPTFENLGIEYLSAVLQKQGHQTELALDPCLFHDDIRYNRYLNNVLSFKNHIVKKIAKSKPDLICFSSTSDRYQWACELAKAIKDKLQIPIAFGGIHPTSVPEEVINNNSVDFVVVGEGEGAIVDLVKSLENKDGNSNIANVWFKKNGRVIRNEPRDLIQDLDSLPFPDKDLYAGEFTDFYNQYSIVTSRGCPFSCTYCSNNYLKKLYHGKGQYVRYRSIENVIAELKSAKERYKIKSVLFFDEELFFDTDRVKKLFDLYKKEINIPFWCYINPQVINEEKIAILESSGCHEVEIGVQDLDASINRDILKRNVDLNHLKNVIKSLRKAKILIYGDIILGLPNQKEQNLIDMANFFNENRLDFPMVFWLRYYPKTEIIDIAAKTGALSQNDYAKLNYSYSFYVRGSTYNPRFTKLANLFYLCSLLPSQLMKFIIKNKIYECFPPLLYRFTLSGIIITKIKVLWSLRFRKRGYYFAERAQFYLHYFLEWIMVQFRCLS